MFSTSILNLPPEVLTHLVTFLPTPTQAVLTYTCRHFHHAAEEALYAFINLHPTVNLDRARQRYPDLLEQAIVTVGDQEDGFYVDMELNYLVYHYQTKRLIRRVHDALLARPARTAYVKRLSVYVIDGLVVDLRNLVDVLRAHLSEVDIAVHDEVSFVHDDAPDEEYPDTCREFWAATTRLAPMTRLRRLKADIGSRELHDLAALLRWGPELASLELAIATGFDLDRDSVPELSRGWPSMGNLRTLRLREVEVDFLPFIAAMIEHAPHLRALTIHSLFDEHERIPTAVAKVLRRKESLRYLEWVDVSLKMPLVMDGTELLADGFESLETVVQGGQPWSPLRHMSSWPELVISPKLKHYMYAVMPRSTNPHRRALQLQASASSGSHGVWDIGDRLRALSKLKSIRCFGSSSNTASRVDAAWRDDDFGVEIRTISPGLQCHAANEPLVCLLPRYGITGRSAQTKFIAEARGVDVYSSSGRVPEDRAQELYGKLSALADAGTFDDSSFAVAMSAVGSVPLS